ncbi:MAG TPA: EVE domain-containing protein [Thermoanaerobaculia bacterium]
MRYWINTVSRSHVQTGIEGGFTQTEHGKESRLRRLAKGDQIVFYSPRTDQKFTAIGEVIDEAPYQEETGWRRRMRFATAQEAAIQPLIEQLEFIRNKKSWGFPFRRGFFEITESDFKTIASAMGA